MKRLTRQQDAFGQMLWAAHQSGRGVYYVIERGDGLVEPDASAGYFRGADEWPESEQSLLALARGRVLDIGCGAGRHSLHLQQQGLDVLGIDRSPLAVKVCRERGLKQARVLWINEISHRLGTFDTILMLGNNFGLFANFRRARWLLRRMHGMMSDTARLLVQSRDPYDTCDPQHLAYHRANRRRGRMTGQLKLRVRYRMWAAPWFDYLMVSQAEMRDIVAGTGWQVTNLTDAGDSQYFAVIEKEALR